MASDPLDAVAVDRQGCCRWSEVTRAFEKYRERIERLEYDLEYISRLPIMDSLTAINMRAVARTSMKGSWHE